MSNKNKKHHKKESKKYPKISIVMLNYNGLKYIKKTIPPLLDMSYPDYEILIVDNGSTDGSIEYIKKQKKIRLVKNKRNLGYSKGKNIGVENSKGKYVLLLDNDILVRNKNIIEELLKTHKKEKNSGFVYVPVKDRNKKKINAYGLFFTFYGSNLNLKPLKFNSIKKIKNKYIPSPDGKNMFFRKEVWEELGGFDESQSFNLDDIDIGPRAWIYGYKNILHNKDFFMHLGIGHTFSAEEYSKRFKLLFSGHSTSMFKNFKTKNIIKIFPVFFIFCFIKSIRYSYKKRSLRVFLAFLSSIILFMKKIKNTL